MASPLFGTDPLSGTSYSYGGRLATLHRNNVMDWLRGLDLAIEYTIAENWPVSNSPAGIAITGVQQIAYDASDNAWMIVGSNAGAPEAQISYDGLTWTSVTPTNVSGAASASCVAANQSGTWVVGCSDGTVRRTTDKGATWTEPAPGGAAVDSIWWDDVNSQFILSEGGQGSAYSANGTAWTRNATAYPGFAGKTVNGGCTNRSNLLVVTANNHNQCATSPDGITWTARTMPVSGDYNHVCWSPGFSKFFAVDFNIAAGGLVSSADGVTWASVSPTLPFTAALTHIVCSGNLLVATADGATDYVVISVDQGLNWTAVLELSAAPVALAFGASATSGGRLAAVQNTPTVYLSHAAAL